MSVPANVQSIRQHLCLGCPKPCANQSNLVWFATPCSSCPLPHDEYPQRWDQWDCEESSQPPTEPPPILTQISTATSAAIDWAKSGFAVADSELYQTRLAICQSCEFWKDQFGGRCMKCGCSTQAKLRMASASCPIKKWEAQT